VAKNAKATGTKASGGANLGLERTLSLAADRLRTHLDAAEYICVVLSPIILQPWSSEHNQA